MRNDAIRLEEKRIGAVHMISDFNAFHERHRIFPEVLNLNRSGKILDIAAGIGIVGKRVRDRLSNADITCNEISPSALELMNRNGLKTSCFDIDTESVSFPFPESEFNIIIALATIEHLINIGHFLSETHRILRPDGHLYLSAPNYSGIMYLFPFLLTGRTFHDPLNEADRYEFYAHVRYFTFRTLVELTESAGFKADTVFLAIPEQSSKFKNVQTRSPVKAFLMRHSLRMLYKIGSPRWASEPVIRFRKKQPGEASTASMKTIKKVVL